jgi:hypothetical protein
MATSAEPVNSDSSGEIKAQIAEFFRRLSTLRQALPDDLSLTVCGVVVRGGMTSGTSMKHSRNRYCVGNVEVIFE